MKTFTLLTFILACSGLLVPKVSWADAGGWCLVADGRQTIPLSAVRCIVASDESDAMTVVTDEGIISDIYTVKFRYVEQSAVTTPTIPGTDTPVFIMARNEIRIWGLADDTKITIYSADGHLADSGRASSDTSQQIVPITHLAPGLYILAAGSTSFKFFKP